MAWTNCSNLVPDFGGSTRLGKGSFESPHIKVAFGNDSTRKSQPMTINGGITLCEGCNMLNGRSRRFDRVGEFSDCKLSICKIAERCRPACRISFGLLLRQRAPKDFGLLRGRQRFIETAGIVEGDTEIIERCRPVCCMGVELLPSQLAPKVFG